MATNSVGRPPGSRNFKTIIMMEKAVRLEANNIPDARIADHLGLTLSGLATMKTKPEYTAIRTRIITGVISDYEEGLGEDLEYLRTELREHVPRALQTLVNALGSNDEKVRITVAESLLDRHGHITKVSRTGLPTEEQGGLGSIGGMDTTIADGLITAISAAKGKGNENISAKTGTGPTNTNNATNDSGSIST